MAAEVRKRRGLEATLIKGSGGQFEVVLDGRLIFSKKQQGRFPNHSEVLDQIPASA